MTEPIHDVLVLSGEPWLLGSHDHVAPIHEVLHFAPEGRSTACARGYYFDLAVNAAGVVVLDVVTLYGGSVTLHSRPAVARPGSSVAVPWLPVQPVSIPTPVAEDGHVVYRGFDLPLGVTGTWTIGRSMGGRQAMVLVERRRLSLENGRIAADVAV